VKSSPSPVTKARTVLPSGPEFLFQAVRVRVHSSVTDDNIRQVLVPALSELAMLARQREVDGRGMDADPTRPESWQDVCDWLVGVVGRFNRIPAREVTQ
jgi:hypothetical protein